jgi:hypothetical protein
MAKIIEGSSFSNHASASAMKCCAVMAHDHCSGVNCMPRSQHMQCPCAAVPAGCRLTCTALCMQQSAVACIKRITLQFAT